MAAMRKTTTLALASASLLLVACGSSSNGDNGSGASEAQRDAAQIKFARCMRSNGINIPDPGPSSQGVRIAIPRNISPEKMQGIEGSCRKSSGLDKAMPAPSAAKQKEIADDALKFASCMRSHGIEMPDPKVSQGRVAIMIPRSANPNTPRFKQAQQACQKLMPGPGPGSKGGPGGGAIGKTP
jgi:hypothetical protein